MLFSVIVSVDVPPVAIDTGLKALLTVGGPLTVSVAEAGPMFVSISFVTMALAGIVFT